MAGTESPSTYTNALCSLGLYTGRVTGSVVGRPMELATIESAFDLAQKQMACLALEGEPGIGKTRLLLAIDEMARTRGFLPMAVTADEEIQGPFLIARSIFAAPACLEALEGSSAAPALERAMEAMSNQVEPGLASLAPDQKLLRVYDLASIALRSLAAEQPIAILVDDLQWADDDSLRMLRYVCRVNASSPILLVFAMRPNEAAFMNEAVTLLADIGRLGILKRVRLARFNQLESTEFLQQVLGGPINLSSAAAMHAQAEGVPFVLAEQAHAYRDAGLVQEIDGVWTLARNAERMVPSAVQTLIRRRGAHLSDDTKAVLSMAAILGRSFSLRDLREVKQRLGEGESDPETLAELLGPAVTAALLVQLPDVSPADYSFTHDQIRQYALEAMPTARRRAVHGAIVAMLTDSGDPSAESLTMVAQHALAAGQADLAARSAAKAASVALAAHAPEEVIRLVELAHPIAAAPLDRVELLRLRDDALDMLRRPGQRLEGLTELAALADALGDTELELEIRLRRAAAMRLSDDHEQAAELARRVRERATELEMVRVELAACLELGQDLLHAELGTAYAQTPTEGDLDGAEEAYTRASVLAEETGDEPRLAAAVRELGAIAVSHVRIWFIERIAAGEHIEVMRALTEGAKLDDILAKQQDIAPVVVRAKELYRRALEIYERLGDRQGAMVTVIAMAYLTWGPEIHLTGSAKRIEELHRLTMRMKSLTKESDRAVADVQMLFGTHVYSRAKVFPDLAISKGREAYNAARALGDRSLEFALTGGIAMAYADIGEMDEARRWIERAVTIASAEPTPLRARQLESWRGQLASLAGDAEGMRRHLTRAADLAGDQGWPAARCESLAMLAREAARLGAELNDEELLSLAERSANDARALMNILPGHPTWGAEASAALARVAMARGKLEEAASAGRTALSALDGAMKEDPFLPILLPAAEALLACGTPEEKAAVNDRLRLTLALTAQRIIDEDVRVKWFRGPVGRELVRLAGELKERPGHTEATDGARALSEQELRLLRLLAQGRTNREIAEELGETESEVLPRLANLYIKIGASSRADATAVALMGKLV